MRSEVAHAIAVLLRVAELAAITAWAAAGRAADWPQWRGPNRDGVSSETGWLASWPAGGPKVLWRKALGHGYSSVAVVGDRAYTLGNKADTDVVYCLDAASGREVWTHEYACRGGPDEAGPRATPTVADGVVYTVSRHGDTRCLDAKTGRAVWAVEVSKVEQLKWSVPRQGLNEVSGSPFVEGKLVIVNAERAIVALDKATGQVAWAQKDEAASGGHSSPLAFDMGGERCVLIFGGREAVGLSARTGDKLWSLEWQNTANAADPSVLGDRVFFSSGYGTGCAMLRPARGAANVLWRNKRLSTIFSSAVVWQGHIYGFDGQANNQVPLVCLDAATGQEKWRHHGLHMGTLMVAGGKLVMLTETGELVIAEASPEKCNVLAQAKVLRGRCWTVPVLCGGRIFCRNHEGELVCLDVRPP
ncbi:MAG: alcohol dehydrogenase [Planctomycetes bacterium]|nr:alcohol dehydrogenase [Planctomycetota bacterium]